MTSIIVGAPVYRREWIIDQWFDYTLAALKNLGMDYSFAFIGDSDDPTFEKIANRGESVYLIGTTEGAVEELKERDRFWDHDRYHKMVYLRNTLLGIPRQYEPDFYLSLDTDILLHPNALVNLAETYMSHDFDAVGGKCHMHPNGRRDPSYLMEGRGGNFHRSDADGVFSVDIIMAIKLMNKRAYNVDYEFHAWGEDVGWSKACRANGLHLGWDGRITNKHVMTRQRLEVEDVRAGF